MILYLTICPFWKPFLQGSLSACLEGPCRYENRWFDLTKSPVHDQVSVMRRVCSAMWVRARAAPSDWRRDVCAAICQQLLIKDAPLSVREWRAVSWVFDKLRPQGARMLVGDGDGAGSVFSSKAEADPSGVALNVSVNLVLSPGEKLHFWRIGSRLNVTGPPLYPIRSGEMTEFFPDAGSGTMYFTDRRIVFLRHPSLDEIGWIYSLQSPRSVGTSAIPEAVRRRVFRVLLRGGVEYLEVGYEEVTSFKEGKHAAMLIIRGYDDKTRTMILPAADFKVFILPMLERRLVEGERLPAPRKPPQRTYDRSPPGLVKDNRGYSNGLALMAALLSLAIGVVVLGAFLYTSYQRNDPFGIVFGVMIFAMFFLFFRVAINEWRTGHLDRKHLSHTYRCPNCRTLITRESVGCPSCGAVVWWVRYRDRAVARAKARG